MQIFIIVILSGIIVIIGITFAQRLCIGRCAYGDHIVLSSSLEHHGPDKEGMLLRARGEGAGRQGDSLEILLDGSSQLPRLVTSES